MSIAVCGIGIVSAIGIGAGETLGNLRTGRSGIEQDSFKMTLIFPLEYKTAAENYLASNGKQKLIELCLAEMGVG